MKLNAHNSTIGNGSFPTKIITSEENPVVNTTISNKKKNSNNALISNSQNASDSNGTIKYQQSLTRSTPLPISQPSALASDSHNKQINNGNMHNNSNNNQMGQLPSPPPPPISKPNECFNARVLFSYVPVNNDELPIQENDVVQVIRLVSFPFHS